MKKKLLMLLVILLIGGIVFILDYLYFPVGNPITNPITDIIIEKGYLETRYRDGGRTIHYDRREYIDASEAYDFTVAITLATDALEEYLAEIGCEEYTIVSQWQKCVGRVLLRDVEKYESGELELDGTVYVVFEVLANGEDFTYGVIVIDGLGNTPRLRVYDAGTHITQSYLNEIMILS